MLHREREAKSTEVAAVVREKSHQNSMERQSAGPRYCESETTVPFARTTFLCLRTATI